MYEALFVQHARLLKALAHPRRLEIIHLLKESPLMVGDIQAMLGLPQANLSQHLKILRDAGAVSQTHQGQHREYRLAHPNFTKASQAMREVVIERNTGRTPDEFRRWMKDLTPIVQDPVCGMRVSPRSAGAALNYRGNHYYFCAAGCKIRFRAHPNKYV